VRGFRPRFRKPVGGAQAMIVVPVAGSPFVGEGGFIYRGVPPERSHVEVTTSRDAPMEDLPFEAVPHKETSLKVQQCTAPNRKEASSKTPQAQETPIESRQRVVSETKAAFKKIHGAQASQPPVATPTMATENKEAKKAKGKTHWLLVKPADDANKKQEEVHEEVTIEESIDDFVWVEADD
jgi:hypothetical protein